MIFTYVPEVWLLSSIELSDNFSESTISEEEKIGHVLIKFFNKSNLRIDYQSIDREDIRTFRHEGLKYIKWEETSAIIGCEFIYQEIPSPRLPTIR